MCLSRRRLTIEHFPIFLDLKGRHALVLGSGEAATRKAEALSRAGAIVRRAERFQSALLTGCAIAIGADAPDAELRALSRAARDAGIPVNVVDQPALCSFISPATVERGALTIAIGSGGSAPMLARAVRARIEALLPPDLGRVADLLDELKDELRRRFPDLRARRRIIERLLDGPAGASANAGDASAARLAARQVMFAGEDRPAGMVFLVGGGPGAADLLTLRAQRLLGEADVIVHDRLVGDGVLDMARRDARRIFVGKQRAMHCMAQAEINALLIELAREGNKVVRLKGGDPFVFGRGGEEAEACARAGIYCEVVPGVTAALACAAQAGIPLTHREAARTVTFVTGHTKDGRLDLDFQTLSRLGGTLVIYMGVETLAPACRGLREGGLPDATPAVLVERGGTAQVRVLRGTLADLAERAVAWGTGGPALVLIGEAAGRRVDMAMPAASASAAPAAGPLALAG